jgi:hypothetical protein
MKTDGAIKTGLEKKLGGNGGNIFVGLLLLHPVEHEKLKLRALHLYLSPNE